jgi:hypothetical protein
MGRDVWFSVLLLCQLLLCGCWGPSGAGGCHATGAYPLGVTAIGVTPAAAGGSKAPPKDLVLGRGRPLRGVGCSGCVLTCCHNASPGSEGLAEWPIPSLSSYPADLRRLTPACRLGRSMPATTAATPEAVSLCRWCSSVGHADICPTIRLAELGHVFGHHACALCCGTPATNCLLLVTPQTLVSSHVLKVHLTYTHSSIWRHAVGTCSFNRHQCSAEGQTTGKTDLAPMDSR